MFIVGLVLLFFGKDIFWLILAGSGCVAGLYAVRIFFDGAVGVMEWVWAAAGGILGVILAIFFQYIAIALLGLICGAYFTYSIPDIFGYEPLAAYTIVTLLGGIAGGVLAVIFFSWALLIFTSLLGATMAAHAIPGSILLKAVVLVVFTSAGIAFQSAALRRKQVQTPHGP